MNLVTIIGIVGSVASVVALLLPATGWKARVVHVLYGLFISALATAVVVYQGQLAEIRRVESQAGALIRGADLSTDGSSRGFMLASLAFLEKNKEQFPETFRRAVALCDNVGVTISAQDDAVVRLHQGWRLTDGAAAMRALVSGIAVTTN